MTLQKAVGKFDKYSERVIRILKKKCPNIEFNPQRIVDGFVLGFAPSIIASALIKTHELKK